jgi:hypothetical protein
MKADENPLRSLDRHSVSIPLVVAATGLLIVLLVGFVLSLSSPNALVPVLFAVGIATFLIVIILDIAKTRRLAAVDDRKFIRWDTAIPEVQRENVNLEVRELGKLLGVGDDGLNDLLSAYVVAEDLALRQIQQEENLPLMRHVSIGKTPFDGILVDQDLITCIEVSFLVKPDVRQEKIESMLKKITQAKRNLAELKSRLRLRLMLVLVTQLTDAEEEELRGMLITRRFSDTPVDIDIRLLDFEMLQKVYVSE